MSEVSVSYSVLFHLLRDSGKHFNDSESLIDLLFDKYKIKINHAARQKCSKFCSVLAAKWQLVYRKEVHFFFFSSFKSQISHNQ